MNPLRPMVVTDGETFVPRERTIEYAENLVSNGGRILGIEGFIARGDCFEPQLGLIADFSAIHHPQRSLEATIKYFADVAHDDRLYFVFSVL